MPRYKLTVEYDGTPYVGFQRQANGFAVQQALEEALEGFAEHPVRIVCAGRTDTGVHALGQVVHADIAKDLSEDKVRDAANAWLKEHSVNVLRAERVDEGFDARRSAIGRAYRYRILDRRVRPALDRLRVWHIPTALDAQAMHAAAQVLVGTHDFTTFRAAACQAKSPVRTLDRIEVARVGAEIHVETAARSFLHNQVRSMVGALMLVGTGRWKADDLRASLESRDRSRCPGMAPAHGLYFIAVEYPEKYASRIAR